MTAQVPDIVVYGMGAVMWALAFFIAAAAWKFWHDDY